MPENFSLGLVGHPLEHSLSPRIHAAALQAAGLKGEYQLYPVPPLPGGTKALNELFVRMQKGTLNGLNVTIPHKQAVLSWLEHLTPAAKAIGAVNTISLKSEQLAGDNTDAPGFLADLNRLGWSVLRDGNLHALVLGAGGSARAVVYALARSGWNISVAARRLEAAEELVTAIRASAERTRPIRGREPLIALQLDRQSLARLTPVPSLIINATPLGMHPFEDTSPWPEGLSFPSHAAIYDLVYNPPETKFMKDAKRAGLRTANGLGMLIEQAALSFEIWTGCTARRDSMLTAVNAAWAGNI